jgi:hypothetical protein
MFWFSLQLLSEIFLILRRIQRGVIVDGHRSLCKVPVILVGFYWHFDVFDRFSRKYGSINFYENYPEGAELFNADLQAGRRTDGHDEADSRFSQFCEKRVKCISYLTQSTFCLVHRPNCYFCLRTWYLFISRIVRSKYIVFVKCRVYSCSVR